MLAFRIFSGKVSFDHIEAHDLLTIKILDETELEACTEGWKEAEHWTVLWSKEKVVNMFTKACKDMTDAEWSSFPRTTNAVESQNALGKIKSKTFLTVVENLFEIDLKHAFDEVATDCGIKTSTTEKMRAIRGQTRRSSRYRPTIANENDNLEPPVKKSELLLHYTHQRSQNQDASASDLLEDRGKSKFADGSPKAT